MPSLPELVRDLERMLEDIGRLTTEGVARSVGGPSHHASLRLAETASDVLAAGRMLTAAHRAGIQAFSKARTSPKLAWGDAWLVATQPPELDRLRVVMKAWLFFVRALCDNAYRLLLAQVANNPARSSGSMGAAAGNPANPVAQFLATEAPEFMPWFVGLRQLRNVMKDGASFGFTQLDARGLELTVYTLTADRRDPSAVLGLTPVQSFTFADLAEGARRIRELLALLTRP